MSQFAGFRSMNPDGFQTEGHPGFKQNRIDKPEGFRVAMPSTTAQGFDRGLCVTCARMHPVPGRGRKVAGSQHCSPHLIAMRRKEVKHGDAD